MRLTLSTLVRVAGAGVGRSGHGFCCCRQPIATSF